MSVYYFPQGSCRSRFNHIYTLIIWVALTWCDFLPLILDRVSCSSFPGKNYLMDFYWYINIFLSTETIEKEREERFEEEHSEVMISSNSEDDSEDETEIVKSCYFRQEKPSLKDEEIMFDRILAYLKVRFPFNLG